MPETVVDGPPIHQTRADGALVQVVSDPRPALAGLTAFALKGEPSTDRGFVTPAGKRLRIRMVPMQTGPTIAVPGSTVPATSSVMAFRLSVALLDASDAVAKDVTGALVISPPRELYFHPDLMVAGADIPALVDLELRRLAGEFEKRIAQQNAVVSYIKEQWPGSEPTPITPVVVQPAAPFAVRPPV